VNFINNNIDTIISIIQISEYQIVYNINLSNIKLLLLLTILICVKLDLERLSCKELLSNQFLIKLILVLAVLASCYNCWTLWY